MGITTSSTSWEQMMVFRNKLLITPVSVSDNTWTQLWLIESTQAEVWTAFSLHFLRRIKQTQPYNLAAMLHNLTSKLSRAVFSPRLTSRDIAELVRVVRVLTRVLCVVMENPTEYVHKDYLLRGLFPGFSSSANEAKDEKVSGAPLPPPPPPPSQSPPASPTETSSSSSTTATGELWLEEPPLTRLALLLCRALFCPGFTVRAGLTPAQTKSKATFVNAKLLWSHGLELSVSPQSPVAATPNAPVAVPAEQGIDIVELSLYQNNRVEVMRCLLVLLSSGIFVDPASYRYGCDPAAQVLVSTRNPLMATLCLSLFNTVTQYQPKLPSLPYAHALWIDHQQPLAHCACHVLLLLLYFHPPPAISSASQPSLSASSSASSAIASPAAAAAAASPSSSPSPAVPEASAAVPTSSSAAATDVTDAGLSIVPKALTKQLGNGFLSILRRIKSQVNLAYLLQRLTSLVFSSACAQMTYLPYSQSEVKFAEEALVLLWKLMEESAHFVKCVLDSPEQLRQLLQVVIYSLDCSREASKMGSLYTCTFILLKLSSERAFAVQLNEAYPAYLTLPTLEVTGAACYVDTLVLLLCSLAKRFLGAGLPNANTAAGGAGGADSTTESLVGMQITILANISPYLTVLSREACVALTDLLDSLITRKSQLLQDQLLLLFANVVQYQYPGNANLVAALLQRGPKINHMSAAATDPADQKQAQRQTCLRTLTCLLDFYQPKLAELQAMSGRADLHELLVSLVRKSTMVGVLPVPHPIVVRRYVPNRTTAMWFVSYLWGLVFLYHQDPPLFESQQIRMFRINAVNHGKHKTETPPEEQDQPAVESPRSAGKTLAKPSASSDDNTILDMSRSQLDALPTIPRQLNNRDSA